MNTEQQLRLPSLGCLWLETACCRDLLLRAGYHSLDTVHNKHTEVPGHSTTVNPSITVCACVYVLVFFSPVSLDTEGADSRADCLRLAFLKRSLHTKMTSAEDPNLGVDCLTPNFSDF